MNPSILKPFDGDAAKAAKPIFIVRKDALENANAPDALRSLAAANGFVGDAGAILASENGVLFGIGNGEDALVYAALSEKLPKGVYAFATPMTARDASLASLAWRQV